MYTVHTQIHYFSYCFRMTTKTTAAMKMMTMKKYWYAYTIFIAIHTVTVTVTVTVEIIHIHTVRAYTIQDIIFKSSINKQFTRLHTYIPWWILTYSSIPIHKFIYIYKPLNSSNLHCTNTLMDHHSLKFTYINTYIHTYIHTYKRMTRRRRKKRRRMKKTSARARRPACWTECAGSRKTTSSNGPSKTSCRSTLLVCVYVCMYVYILH